MSIQEIADGLEGMFGKEYTRKQYFKMAKHAVKTTKKGRFGLGNFYYQPRHI